jgi:hypothetical protein
VTLPAASGRRQAFLQIRSPHGVSRRP